MYINSAYLNNSRLPLKDRSKPLSVSSCGTYRLHGGDRLPTWRPRGRLDYQLLYIAAGKAVFFLGGERREVAAGNMVLFQPRQEQRYEYFGKDAPEVYWVHFTGSEVRNLLRHYGVPLDREVIPCGADPAYAELFRDMIRELQVCRTGYEEMLQMDLRRLFLLLRRNREEQRPAPSPICREMEEVRRYFREHCHEPISIEECARSRGMSVSWFLRSFRRATGRSPMQYVLALRMDNACTLLETTDLSVAEIAAAVGCENPLYFSRLFKKQKGLSPSEYRKNRQKAPDDRG